MIAFLCSCTFSKLIGDKELGDGYVLTEDAKEHCIVKSSTEKYDGVGEIVIKKVSNVNYNKKYIIVLSNELSLSKTTYWIIIKKDVTNHYKSEVIGPLDSINFNKNLVLMKIGLKFEK